MPKDSFAGEMMSQRFTLFYAGFTAHAPALYFNQLDFIDKCRQEKNASISAQILKLTTELQDKIYESDTHIKTALSVAKNFEIEVLPKPENPADYFNWLSHYIESFEKEFPMGRIDHYYFLFARKISEILCNTGLLSTYIDTVICSEGSLDFSRKMDKSLKDIEFILFKLMAAAALLSSEPRQNYFNVYYKTLCLDFKPLKDANVETTDNHELLTLQINIKEFDLKVMDGFKKCIGLLKEIGV